MGRETGVLPRISSVTTFTAVVEILILIAMFFLPQLFFLSIAIRSIGVHHTVPGYIDQNVFGLQRTAKKKKKVITS